MRYRLEGIEYMGYIIKIYGIVQGVGFRPFVYQLAQKYCIYGWVKNSAGCVVILCSGERLAIKAFIQAMVNQPPKLSQIEKIRCIPIKKPIELKHFYIKPSDDFNQQLRFVSPDTAICSDCLREIQNKHNRRYRYPFTNCTHCGPRYSIIKTLPYDRTHTTMEHFVMCQTCQTEYDLPSNRRFHAQPNCCTQCGPKLMLIDNKGIEISCDDVINKTIEYLLEGRIIAVKGIGGFHLVCDAKNESVIQLLRNRKLRPDKPLALMAKDMTSIRQLCFVSAKEEEILSGNKRPIVLLKKKASSILPEVIAPGQNRLGVMLAYTPLHYLLFDGQLEFLIMTSANISGMPIEYKNDSVIEHLSTIADYFLIHDRAIHMPLDDSVVKVVEDKELVVRRARGYTPYSIKSKIKHSITAVGAQQKNTVCVSKDGYVHLSQYLGDLENLKCYENFQYVLEHFTRLFNIDTDIFAYDMHPAYCNSVYIQSKPGHKIAIQHHHAHMVSCMAEHRITCDAIGIVLDGTGFGLDGAVWGGEFLVGNTMAFKRVAQLEYIKLQGGNLAVKQPWRCAVSYLHAVEIDATTIIKDVAADRIMAVEQALNSNLNCFLSSSIGRLFDAVAAIVGIVNTVSYDGQAAIALENIIEQGIEDCYTYQVIEKVNQFHIQYKELIGEIVNEVMANQKISIISAKFHNTLANVCCFVACKIRQKEAINTVILSGGVFENIYLRDTLYKQLINNGFEVFYNEQIPTNDSGIAFGQVNIADAILNNTLEHY